MSDTLQPTAQEILRITEQVLQRPEFQQASRRTGRRLGVLERILDWLAARGPLSIPPAVPVILRVLFIGLLVLLVLYLLRLLLSGSGRWALPVRRRRGYEKAEEGTVSGGLSGSLADAEQALRRGDLRTAVRILYQRLIESLARRGTLRTALWKTSLTYLRECPPSAQHFALLQQTVGAYNAIVFGHRAYDDRSLAALIDQLRGEDSAR